MHTLAKKFMMARKLDFGENGVAELLDDRVVLMESSLLPAIARYAGGDAAYHIGESMGQNLVKNIGRTGLTGSKMVEFMMDLLTMMGLGSFEIHSFDLTEKTGEIRVQNTVIACDDDTEADCSILAGMLAGMFTQNYGEPFTADIIACVADGDDLCRFKIYQD